MRQKRRRRKLTRKTERSVESTTYKIKKFQAVSLLLIVCRSKYVTKHSFLFVCLSNPNDKGLQLGNEYITQYYAGIF